MASPVGSPRRVRILPTLLLVFLPHAFADRVVRIDSGLVEGLPGRDSSIGVYRGIPFAQPPLGALRWRPPQPVVPWQGVRKLTEFGPRPMQVRLYADMRFRDAGPSEDCLYLSVWTPAKSPGKRLPVMVWLFGGGLQAGSSSEPRQDGENLAKKGVIVVSPNYRLGVFGFLALPELAAESPNKGAGNYGFMDQVAALQWVQRNIAAFGGDPSNVTIFGESAGSQSVSVMVASPLAKGLFHRAIGESGAYLGSKLVPVVVATLADAEAQGLKFEAKVSAKSLADLRSRQAWDLMDASRSGGFKKFGADIDGFLLPQEPAAIFAAGKQSHVPLLAGWNADEVRSGNVFGKRRPTAVSFIANMVATYGLRAKAVLKLYPADTDAQAVISAGDLASDRFIVFQTWKFIEMQYETGNVPVYRYSFDRKVPIAPGKMLNGMPVTSEDIGANHSSEIRYVFGDLASTPGVNWAAEDWKLSETMGTYWTNFAKTGDPNGKGLPQWPRYQKETGYPVMHLNTTVLPGPETHRDRYLFWDSKVSDQNP